MALNYKNKVHKEMKLINFIDQLKYLYIFPNMLGMQKLSISGIRPMAVMTTFKKHKHALPDLPYDYNALEPVISAEIMQIHHQKHHATYVNNLNQAEEKTQEALVKGDIRTAIHPLKFNGGGHINHCIFWTNLCKDGGEPSGHLLQQINKDFGSIQAMKDKLSAISIAIQGSGWGWLGYNKEAKRLELAGCPNQDPLEPTTGLVPIFGIDVWEHAYYLQYKNVRADYVKNIWKIANWKNVEERLVNAEKA